MEKLKLHSPDFTQENIAKLAELFPNCVTEIKDEGGRKKDEKGGGNSSFSPHPSSLRYAIDFDQLRQELSTSIVEGNQERYQLNWPGKREALLTANAPIAKTLRPCRDESVDFDTTQNLFIEGDNLDALKLLQETYLNKVKMIYIDPPYNTGNDFIYEDDFAEDSESYFERSNQKDEIGNRMIANTEANGRFHSDWLTMMYSRLKLARNLLDSDGVICVSISDIEAANVRSLLNEIFGEQNYVNTISVVAKVSAGASGGGEDKRLKKNIEYILIFAKSFGEFNTLTHLYTERPLIEVINEMREEGESWKYTSILLGAAQREYFCTIKDGDGNPIEIYKRNEVVRTTISKVCKEERIDETTAYKRYFAKIFSDTNAQTSIRERVIEAVGNLGDNEILEVEYVPRSGRDKGQRVTHTYISNTVRRVIWLSDVSDATNDQIIKKEKLGTLWSNFDYNNVGKEGEVPFPDGKKPIDLIRTCIQLYGGKEGVFMDFFAGSCSLPHAVIRENMMDCGARRFIAIQLPEHIDTSNKKYEAALRFYDAEGIPPIITEIGKERIRRAGKKIKAEVAENVPQLSLTPALPLREKELDIGFRVLKIDSSNMKDVYYVPDAVKQGDLLAQVDNICEDRTPEDLLFQVLLDWGVDLALPITQESIAGRKVFFVDGNALAACFETGINEEFVKALAARHPLRAVFRDSGFGSDSVKINIEQIFKLVSPTTEVKSI